MDWQGLSDFINSSEAPTLGIYSAISGNPVNVAQSGDPASGDFSFSSSPTGAYAASPTGVTIASPNVVQGATASALSAPAAALASPGMLLIVGAVILGIVLLSRA
jgi:hypothetical protein